jgi:hypothetical protein
MVVASKMKSSDGGRSFPPLDRAIWIAIDTTKEKYQIAAT